MKAHVKLLCPAKLNLGLRIPFKLPSGYHHLVSLFCPINLFDELWIEPCDRFTLLFENNLPSGFGSSLNEVFTRQKDGRYNNILQKTWDLVVQNSKEAIPPIQITVKKNIPSPAGLGGASSNAAALLMHLNQYAKLSKGELASLAFFLGADVSFFLENGAALVSGIGERDSAVFFKPLQFIIGVPPFGFATKEMFSVLKKDLQPVTGSESILTKVFSEVKQAVDWLLLDEYSVTKGYQKGFRLIPNDFLPSIWGFYLNEAAIIKDGMVAANEALMAHCRRETVGYGLTGSGSAFYAVCEGSERQTTEWAVSELRKSHSSFAWYAAENLL